MEMGFSQGEAFALQMDQEDPLKDYRNEFFISSEESLIYLDGNSLGRLPALTRDKIREVTDKQWGTRLIRSWNEGWYDRAALLSRKIERIIGAAEGEVAVCDSTSLNLYKLAFAAIRARPGRRKIVSDDLNFPADLYVLQSIVTQLGPDYILEVVRSSDGICVATEALGSAIDEDTALVVLSHVAFKSAFKYNMKEVTELAHEKGALILWDLSHAAGAVDLELTINKVDLAVGCTYKYLNGGPGAPAYLYANKEILDQLTSPIWGWFGEENPFAFRLTYEAANDIRKFLIGTPPVLSMEAIDPGLNILLSAGMDRVRRKSVLLTEYLIYLYDNNLKDLGFSLGTPRDPEKRGSHVSLRHKEAYRICRALIHPVGDAVKVIPDFREPDNIRLGCVPLYNTFSDVYYSVERIRHIMINKEFEHYTEDREAVT